LDKHRFQDKGLHILLIPPVINPVSTEQAINFIPVGLLVLLSTLEESGLRAAIYKPEILIVGDPDLTRVARDIVSLDPGALGFSTWCDSFPISLLLAEEIEQIAPDIPVIFGGPQASILAEDTLTKHPAIDFVLKGEADHTLPGLVSRLMNGDKVSFKSIPGLVYRDLLTNAVISDSPAEFVKDIDLLPVPAYEKIFQKSKVRIDAGRGCPFPCTYCTTNQFFSKKYRVKSPGRIIAEMEYCHQEMGVARMGISHDMFTLDKSFMADFTGRLMARNKRSEVPFTWTCSARTDCVTEEMLDQMKESGCRAIFFGIESGSGRIQAEIRKNLDIEEAGRMIAYSAGLGMVTIASYMAGFPGETKRDLNDTLRSILEVALAGGRPQLTLLSVLPGTPIYQQYAEDLEYDEVHSGFSVMHPTEKMKNLIKSDPKAFSSFYYLPNEHISRQTYLFLADLVNNIEHFLPTLALIREHIRKVLPDTDFIRYIEDNLDKYPLGEDIPLPELYFLTDSLKKFLEYLLDEGLPGHVWDVFQVDFTRAFMIARYERWQILQAANRSIKPAVKNPDPEDIIRPLPYWKLIETHCYLHDDIQDPAGLKGNARFRRGRYHYIVLPVSHRMARLIKVPGALVQIYRDLKESTVGEFIQKNVVILGEDHGRRLLGKMIQQGLVEIEKK
jgi:radical SAM superfamily enzyme YgiQ (UPF0313 family)